MTVTLTSAENALKNVYLDVIANQLNIKANPLLAQIKQTDSNIWGKEIIKLAGFGINGGIGAGTESGSLPTAASNNYVQFRTTLKNLFGKIEISDKAIRASENNSGAFVNLLTDEMEGLIKASSFNLGRMLYGDGSGELATTSAAITSSSTYVEVTDTRNLIEGMVVDVFADQVLGFAGARISYVDRVNNYVYFDVMPTVSAAISAGAKLFVQGSKDNEITGLEAIFGSGDLYGVSRSTYKWLTPYVNSASVAMDDITLQNTIDAIEDKGGNEINYISCARDVRKAYQQYLTYYRRNVDMAELEGGFKAISFNGIPVVADRFVKSGTAYFLNTKDFAFHQLCDWKWLEDEGGRVLKQMPGYPAYTATLVKYADLICERPVAQAKLSAINNTITNPYSQIVTAINDISLA